MDFKSMISGLANRFKEPSSWAGLGAIMGLVGLHMSAAEVGYIVDIGMGAAGLLALFLPEKAK
jgi:hypothetical protein